MQDIAVGPPPQRVVEQIEGFFAPFLLDHELFALTDWKAPNCRFVKIDLHHPKPKEWQDVIPESDSRIHYVAVVGNSIFVTTVKDLATHVEIFDFSGKKLGNIPLPSDGTASLFPCGPDSDTIFYRFTSFAHPSSILRYRPKTGEQDAWTRSQVKFDPSSIEIEHVRYPSKDGTPLPMFLVSLNGLPAPAP